ncbi:hypothetical protein BDC45DRAFT_510807 [Circinella umbellata]|nr:hypothetical protein BDC45DRAFT_510807 [Circinella umbellata]
MTPILHDHHESRLSFHANNLWTELWADLINAFRPISTSSSSRSRKIIHNRIEPLVEDTVIHVVHHHHHCEQEETPFESSKFQLEYVSFPRLAEEDQLLKNDYEDDDEDDYDNNEQNNKHTNDTIYKSKTHYHLQEQQDKLENNSNNDTIISQRRFSEGGSRRRLLGSSWMF